MSKVNPIGILNSKAHSMVTGLITDSPYKQEYIHGFFDMANKYNVQGPALLSYYTALKDLRNSTDFMKNNNLAGIKNFEKYVADLIVENHDASNGVQENPNKEVIDMFVKRLNELYSKNLRTRISLANQGAVRADKVEKVSFKKQAMVRISLLLDKLVEKGESYYKKIYKYCEPVE